MERGEGVFPSSNTDEREREPPIDDCDACCLSAVAQSVVDEGSLVNPREGVTTAAAGRVAPLPTVLRLPIDAEVGMRVGL